MVSDLDRTHHLECERFAEALRTLAEAVLPTTTAAVVRLHEDEMTMEPDGADCRRTWNAVRERFERVPDADRNGATAWRGPTTTEAGREAVIDLLALTDGVAGAHFVFQVELRREGVPVLESIPHHADVGVDATLLDDRFESGGIVGLDGHDACLVPVETHFEWTAEDRRWRLAGGSLCLESLDGRTTSCYGVTNLRRAVIGDDGTTLVLAWEPGDLPDDAIGSLLSWITGALYDPPPAVPCGTPRRAKAVQSFVRELLAAYDGRDVIDPTTDDA